jgi:hypothetical protein
LFLFKAPSKLALALLFVFCYWLAVLYCQDNSSRDPTSYFFDPVHSYDKIYSHQREQEALAYIQSANIQKKNHTTSSAPKLCLGVATISRPKEQYIRKTIGSLLDGLSEEERQTLHFVLFIAHTDPHLHPIYGERWVESLPDALLSYDVDEKELMRIKKWEKEKDHRSKGLYDYAYLLQSCYNTGAPFIAILEGDVLAVDGWYPRAVAAAEFVEEQSPENREDGASSWLYLRLFYTEAYLGWNSEEWQRYLGWSLLIFAVLTATLIKARSLSYSLQRNLSNTTLAVITLVCLPASISLYFAAGGVTMQPPAPGVRRMDNFGCCSQGFIYARRTVPLAIEAIHGRAMEYMDMLMEATAASNKMTKWAVYPSLLQHIGGESSKGDAVSDLRAKMIWNFAFETYRTTRHQA